MLSAKEQSIYSKLAIERSIAIADGCSAIARHNEGDYQHAKGAYEVISVMMRSEFAETDEFIIKEAKLDVEFPEWTRTDAEDVVELLDINGEVTVAEAEVIAVCSNLEVRRENAIGVAEYAANEAHDYGLYLTKEAEVRDIDHLLRLSMFRVYKPDMSKQVPEWVSRPEDDFLFIDDCNSGHVVFSDGSYVDDDADVPF